MITSGVDIQESLEADFPLIDTSLLAALISELPSPPDLTPDSIRSLRQTLYQLSLEADTQQQQADSNARSHNGDDLRGCTSPTQLDSEDLRESEQSGSSPADDLSLSVSGISSSVTSATSSICPLEFLHILFPHLSIVTIEDALRECNVADDDSLQAMDVASDEIDLSVVVDHLLNLEYIQDLVDRGLQDTDTESDTGPWHIVGKRGKQTSSQSTPEPRPRKHTVPLIDMRQRQHAPVIKPCTASSSSYSGDPWTRFTSLATRLSDLLQPTPPGFFMSYLHTPVSKGPNTKAGWKGESDAVRLALTDLAKHSVSPIDETELGTAVETMCSMLLNHEAENTLTLDVEHQSRIMADVRLCSAAARGDSAAALDLVWLLRELDEAFDRGDGVAHSVVEPVINRASSSRVADPTRGPVPIRTMSTPPSARPPTRALPTQPPPLPPPSNRDRGWIVVTPRRPALKHAHPHAEFIPAYSRANKRSVKGPGNRFGKGGKGDVGELGHGVEWYRAQADEFQNQRNAALHEATRYWKSGNAKSRGGEVALYYAEKARELQEQQQKWTLEAARMMVEEKRSTSRESDTLDLHGLTVTEARVIVKETVDATPPSLGKPLKIITGRGSHSVGRIGVLGPAIRDMLREEGWNVGKWDGGLVVRGKS